MTQIKKGDVVRIRGRDKTIIVLEITVLPTVDRITGETVPVTQLHCMKHNDRNWGRYYCRNPNFVQYYLKNGNAHGKGFRVSPGDLEVVTNVGIMVKEAKDLVLSWKRDFRWPKTKFK